jgi:hypothetical protein
MASSSRLGHLPHFYVLEIELLTDTSTSVLDVRILRFVATLFSGAECFDTDLNQKLLSILGRADRKLGTHYAENGAYSAISNVLYANWISYKKSI